MSFSFELFHNPSGNIKHGLPAYAYTDEGFHRTENQTIFAQNWIFAGFAHQIENAGDVIPITVAGKPIFLVRNEKNQVLAFHNVCRHRCLKLVDQPRNCGSTIRCPYHSWIYGLNGELRVTPFFSGLQREAPEGFSLEENGLVPVACEVWHDWIFLNVDGKAKPFDQFIFPLKQQVGKLPLADVRPVATVDMGVVKCNWKLLMENFIEPYHVQFVHKTTTQQPLCDHRVIIDQHCLGSACDIEDKPSVDKSTTLAVTSKYLTLFPNFVMGTYAPDQIGIHLNIPMGVSETRQFRVIYVHKDNSITQTQIEQLKTLWYDVHKEDHEICERLQVGRQSEVADSGGYLSPHWETSVRRFQEMVVHSTTVA
jgi:choline monooxygenase